MLAYQNSRLRELQRAVHIRRRAVIQQCRRLWSKGYRRDPAKKAARWAFYRQVFDAPPWYQQILPYVGQVDIVLQKGASCER